MTQLFADNASTTITNNPLASGGTTINLATGKGALFPSPTGGDYFEATLSDTGETVWEIVKVTARSSDALTVVRSVATSWPLGSKLSARLTSAAMTRVTANNAAAMYEAMLENDLGCLDW